MTIQKVFQRLSALGLLLLAFVCTLVLICSPAWAATNAKHIFWAPNQPNTRVRLVGQRPHLSWRQCRARRHRSETKPATY